jgi:predicted AlkP superfamily phosphohydrolase/phosphomutase
MPLCFPARLPRGGELLAGLGVPDLRATNGSYTLFAAGRHAYDGHTEFGGRHVKIYPRDGVAEASLEGPPDPRTPESGRRLAVPVTFTFTGGSAAVAIDGGPALGLEPGLYSRWVPVTFRAGLLIRADGLVRFLLLDTGPEPKIYASPIHISPNAPMVPISAPPSFSGRLAERLGPMRTAGWPEDTFAANERVLSDAFVYEDIRDTYRSHERLCLDRLDRSGAALLSMVFTAPDRMSHMFFRYRDPLHPAHDPREIAAFRQETGVEDPIFESYRWMDETVGAVLARLGPRDVLIVVSDHGFHTWRRGLNLNTWLLREGYLALSDGGGSRSMRRLDDFFRRGVSTEEIDWARTRAYALGLGQIYLNLKGRERDGVVEPAEREALLEEIRAKLLRLEDDRGQRVLTEVYLGHQIWRGERMDEAPDLQGAFADGFRVSWQTALLGVPEELFEDNTKAWSGDHCSNDVRETPGVFLCNRRLAPGADPGLEDVAPTVCHFFGAPPPRGAEGRVLPLAPE